MNHALPVQFGSGSTPCGRSLRTDVGPDGAVVVAFGRLFGLIFPAIVALSLGDFPLSLHGRAIGLFFAIGGLGWTAIPMLIGAYAQRTSIQRRFVMAAASSVGLRAIALALLLSA